MEEEAVDAPVSDLDGAPLEEDVDGLPLTDAGHGESKAAIADSADVDSIEMRDGLDGAPCKSLK